MGQEYKISCLGFRKSPITARNMTIYPEKKSGLSKKPGKKISLGHHGPSKCKKNILYLLPCMNTLKNIWVMCRPFMIT